MNHENDQIEPMGNEAMPEVLIREGKQLIKTTTFFQTAITVQKPRVLVRIQEELGKEADLAGEAFYYFWMVDDKKKKKKVPVEGPSIELAVSAARLWGNCVWICDVDEREEMYHMMGHFVDLETGFNVARPFRQRKLPDIGDYEEERKRDQSFQIGVSKCMRNVIVRGGIPKWLINEAMQRAKTATVKRFEAIWKDKKKREETIEKALTEFAKHGISEAQIIKLVGPKKAWTPQTMAQLSGMVQALIDGQSTVAEVLGEEGEGAEADEIKKAFWEMANEIKDQDGLKQYMKEFCETMNVSEIKIMAQATGDWDGFRKGFEDWQKAKGTGKKEDSQTEDQLLPRNNYVALMKLIPEKVIPPEGADSVDGTILPEKLTPNQANSILHFLVKDLTSRGKDAVEFDEFTQKVNKICSK